VLRVCAHAPQPAARSDLTALRVLLIADLLARTAGLRGLQVLTALAIGGPAEQAAVLQSDADALAIHPPAARTSPRDAPSALGGPIDVHLVSQDARAGPAAAGLSVSVGASQLAGAGSRRDPAAGDGLLAGHRCDPLAVRLALMSFPCDQPAALTSDDLAGAAETLGHWRQQVAQWAESPSRPVPAPIAEAAWAAFAGLDTVSALALLRGLVPDTSVPAGAKFEAFVYADRVLGLDLAREIGR
jgi:hypothetical protein